MCDHMHECVRVCAFVLVCMCVCVCARVCFLREREGMDYGRKSCFVS